jgi:NAD(P)-dependent dehydrogenase (short-subunit alcohol dehydrogenase family)
MIGAAIRTTTKAFERAGRVALAAPMGGRVPVLRPAVSRERLTEAVSGRRILLTGASSGIGLETALALGRAGARLTLVARRDERLQEVADRIRTNGGKADTVAADLSDAAAADDVVEQMLERHSGIDVLVNNAGHSIRRPLSRSYDREHDFQRTMDLNYFGALRLILGLLPGMRERREGHVVNVSTMGAEIGPGVRFPAYLASKAALDAFTASAAPETAQDGVTWTTVYMPLVRTPMTKPTRAYRRVPMLSPREASQLVLEGLVDRPRQVSTPAGRAASLLYELSPGAVDAIVGLGYRHGVGP